MTTWKIRIPCLALFPLLFFPLSAVANSYTWTGKAPAPNNQDWFNVQNWSPSNGIPSSADAAIIGGASGFTVNIDSAAQVGQLALTNSILTGAGSLTIEGNSSVTFSDFELSSVVVNGNLDIYPLNPEQNEISVSGSFSNFDQVVVHGNAAFEIEPSALVVNAGFWFFNAGSSLALPNSGSNVTFINLSNLGLGSNSITGGASIFSNAPGGLIEVAENTQFQGTLASAGEIDVASNAVFSVSSARVYLSTGASFDGAGATILPCPVSVNGTVTIPGTLQYFTDGANTANAMTINGKVEITAGGVLNWYGGVFSGVGTNVTGAVVVDQGGTLAVFNDDNGVSINNLILTNNGTVVWTNSGTWFLENSAQIVNQGYFNMEGDSSLSEDNGDTSPVAFQNNGGIVQKLNGGTNNTASLIRVPFNDNGSVSVVLGNVQFLGGGALNSWVVEQTGTIKLSSGTYLASPEAEISGPGPVTMTSPAVLIVQAEGSLDMLGHFIQSGGTISGGGVFSVAAGDLDGEPTAGDFDWNGGTISIVGPFGRVSVAGGCVMNIQGAFNTKTLVNGGIVNDGTINWVNDNSAGGINMSDDASIENFGTFNIQCDASMTDTSISNAPFFSNYQGATLSKVGNTGTTTIGVNMADGGLIVAAEGTLEFVKFSDDYPSALASILLEGGKIKFDNAVTLHADISGSGQIIAGQGLTLSGGDMTVVVIVFSGNIINDETFDLATLFGTITMQGGNFTQTANGVLVIPVQGTNATGGYGKVTTTGNVTLGGGLKVVLTDGYAPPIGASFPFLSGNQVNGAFANLALPQGMKVTYSGAGAAIVVTNVVPAIILPPQLVSGQFQFGFNTVAGRSYTVQYQDVLGAPVWSVLTNFSALSTNFIITVPVNSSAARFYRVVEP
jgi:hypothetical protein